MKQVVVTKSLTNRETESFKQYLKEVAAIPLLTPEEELICAEKASHGDKKAIDELVSKNLRFVITVAKDYVSSNNTIEDLVNEGNIGLMIAAEKFRPNMGYKFISYAVWWIQKYILMHLEKNGRMVRLPANKINSLSKLDKKVSQLEQTLGRPADINEIIEAFGFDEEIVGKTTKKKVKEDQEDEYDKTGLRALDVIGKFNVESLDREISFDGNVGSVTTLGELICDESSQSADQNLIDDDMKRQVVAILNTLKPRDKKIMEALFGMDGREPRTLFEVGEEVGITREMVRQIKLKTLNTFKRKLKNSFIRECQ